ncbi:NAD(P)/FAD-dependent oxidoreductase [Mycolicibacterium mengxianglii]|uniref:NAD(P)/FAD-dependent oxidoreductase n=1 Tax=Mycolicibacterium mengxianglii TaxID=2736649 RepID=UPI0018D1D1CC|nr:FAD-binding oxidoreductase [Mycolicibacterium mengxianglii]
MPEVIVIGGGLEGAATAWALARRGVTDVLVLERATVGAGMTGKSSGIVRCHYGVSSLAAMSQYGLEILESAEQHFCQPVGFHRTGYVVGVGDGDVDALDANLATQRAVGVQTERIDESDVAKLWPTAYLGDFAGFAYEPRGGYGDAYMTAQAFAATARAAGVKIRQGAAVAEIVVETGQVRGVRLRDGEFIAGGNVVLATGVWSPSFLNALGLDLPITVVREQIVMLKPPVDVADVDRLPVLSDLVSLQYVRPDIGGEILFGNSDLDTIETADPDAYSNRADSDFLAGTVEKLSHRFPGLADGAVASTYAGCYDVTPDFNPVMSRTPIAGLVLAVGFSGHGFKIAPAVGRLVADLVIDGVSSDPRIPESDFRLSRFAEGQPLTSPHPYSAAGQLR